MRAQTTPPTSEEDGLPSFYTDWRSTLKRPLFRRRKQLQDGLLRARMLFGGAIRHVHGARRVECADDELVVLCLMRNGEPWIRSFVEHHLALGARHIFFLDNGSTDRSIDRAVAHDRVSVWSSDLPFREYQHAFRRWLTRTFGRRRWALHCDVDELWEYPGSGELKLRGFLRYLNARRYTAVAAQMLDMFSDRPFSELHSHPDDSLRDRYRFYDLRGVERRTDIYWIEPRGGEGHFCTFGGIRERVFGSEGLLQTKHPLARAGDGVEVYPYDGHFVTGARVADVSTVLLHYKFISTLREQAADALRRGQLFSGSKHYRGFHEVLSDNPELCLWSEEARELANIDELVEEGLLIASPAYRAWVAAHAGGRANASYPTPTGGLK